jgi:hypothetical protein
MLDLANNSWRGDIPACTEWLTNADALTEGADAMAGRVATQKRSAEEAGLDDDEFLTDEMEGTGG